MVKELVKERSVVNHFIAELRDVQVQKDPMRFRRNLARIGEVMAVEISRTLEFKETEVVTPLGVARTDLMAEQPVLATILRAGLAMLDGWLRIMPKAEVGFLGMIRDEETLQPTTYAERLPKDLSGRQCYVLDPMLATGGSLATR